MKLRITLSLVALFSSSFLFACGDDDTGPADASEDAEVSDLSMMDNDVEDADLPDNAPDNSVPADDAAVDLAVDAMVDNCGTLQADVSGISGTEGIAIGTDGTIYFSQANGIGRMQPGEAPESNWITGLRDVMSGLAFRESDGMLFAATTSDGGAIYEVDTTAADASAPIFLDNAGVPNGLIVAPDGSVIYSDFIAGNIIRVNNGAKEQVNLGPISRANGLLVDDDGSLLVLSSDTGDIVRLQVNNWVETSRVTELSLDTKPDGIAVDDDGRYYVTDNDNGALLQFDSSFGNEQSILDGTPRAANVAFGRGVLDCTEIYVTSSGPMKRVNVGVGGRP